MQKKIIDKRNYIELKRKNKLSLLALNNLFKNKYIVKLDDLKSESFYRSRRQRRKKTRIHLRKNSKRKKIYR